MNSKLLKVYIGGILASALLFSSCDTFLQGSNLKNQLDEVIKDANAERVKVSVFALNAYGTLTGETGGTYKVETENLSLGFSENKGWQFVEWQVSDSEGNKKGCSEEDFIYIKNPLAAKTSFSVLGSANDYKIEAICMPRPSVELSSPAYLANGVNQDSPIEITFSQPVAEENFIFTQAEFESFGKFAKAIRKNPEDEASDIIGINLAGEVLFKNISIVDSKGNNIASHYNGPVLSADKKKITLTADTSKFFDFSDASVKDVYVTVSSKVGYEYQTQNETVVKIVPEKQFDYNFKVSAVTTEKAKITFSAKNDEDKVLGTLTYNGQYDFNIGQTIKVEFEPNTDFNFVGWDISGNEDNAVSVKTDDKSIVVKVLKSSDLVKIVPVCEEKSKAQILFASTNGTVSPIGYVDCMEGQVIPLSFSCDSSYTFIQWKVVNTVTGETVEKEIADLYYQFEDLYAQSTFLTIKNPKDVYSIVADCYVRPHVYSHYPDINSGSNVKRDQSVKIYFDHDIDVQTLYYTEDEAAQVQKSTDFAGFLYDSVGRYGYKTSDSNQVFKNITITNRATGENYAKFYKQPQLLDSRTLVVPVKVVLKSGSTVDNTKTLPEHTEVMFQLGENVGYYAENGELVSLVLDSNLTWFYKNNGGTDSVSPVVVSSSIKTNGSGSKPLSKVEPVSDDKQSLKDAYLSNWRVDYKVTVKDDSDNLSTLTLKYSHIKTIGSTLVDVPDSVFHNNTSVYSKVLNLVSSDGKNGTSSATVDLNDLEYKIRISNNTFFKSYRIQSIPDIEGIHKIWFEVMDESGNIGESEPYYIIVDKTGPQKSVNGDSLKFFKDGSRIKVCDWKFNEDIACDYESTTMYVKPSGTNVETPYPMDNANKYIFESSSINIRIVTKDVFGNEKEIYSWGSTYLICISSLSNGDYYYADEWYSRNDYSSEYEKLGKYYNGNIVYDE